MNQTKAPLLAEDLAAIATLNAAHRNAAATVNQFDTIFRAFGKSCKREPPPLTSELVNELLSVQHRKAYLFDIMTDGKAPKVSGGLELDRNALIEATKLGPEAAAVINAWPDLERVREHLPVLTFISGAAEVDEERAEVLRNRFRTYAATERQAEAVRAAHKVAEAINAYMEIIEKGRTGSNAGLSVKAHVLDANSNLSFLRYSGPTTSTSPGNRVSVHLGTFTSRGVSDLLK